MSSNLTVVFVAIFLSQNECTAMHQGCNEVHQEEEVHGEATNRQVIHEA